MSAIGAGVPGAGESIRRPPPPHTDLYDDGDYKRKGKKKANPLLIRHQVGRVKSSTYDLPPPDFSFGRRDQQDDEGVREVVHSWKEHKANAEAVPGRDFVRLNKSAALTGCTTAKHIADYRKDNDIRLKGSLTTGARDLTLTVDGLTGSTFGRPSKPSTPIASVLCNVYQRSWIEEQRSHARDEAKGTRSPDRPSKLKVSQHTRASIGHQKVAAPVAGEPFKLKRFTAVPSRVRLARGAKPESLTSADTATLAEAPTGLPPLRRSGSLGAGSASSSMGDGGIGGVAGFGSTFAPRGSVGGSPQVEEY